MLVRRSALPALLSASLVACSSAEDPPDAGFDPARVFEQKTQSLSRADAPFSYEVPTLFRTTAVLPELDVRALSFVEGRLHAGTSSAVRIFDREQQRFVAHADPRATGIAVVDLALRGADLVIGGEREVRVLGAAPATWTSSSATVRAVAASAEAVWIATDAAVWRWVPPAAPSRLAVLTDARDLALAGGTVHVATGAGVRRFVGATMAPLTAWIPAEDVRALTVSGDAILAATARGLARIGVADGAVDFTEAGPGHLPSADLTAVVERGGVVLVGHGRGATALSATARDHYVSLRWLPADRVTAVALGEDGTRWIATPAGVSRVGLATTTLAERAQRFEDLIEAKHWRMDGFVDDDVNLADAWDPTTGFSHDDKDNDGLWTQMQIGPWCLAYSLTKDERYYRSARKAMDVMFMLVDVPALTFEAAGKKGGFVARSLVRDDEGRVYQEKLTSDRWVQQRYQGRDYVWKNDTSSDEYAGHFFGFPLFHDLCAKDDAERKAVADRMRLIADHLIAGDFLLLDLDGEPTTFGQWQDLAASVLAPNDCAAQYPLELCIRSLGGGGWLNGLEILGHLLATWHVTGDQTYYDAYERLYTEKAYSELVPLRESTATVVDPALANHSDHELALLAYFTLLRYEPNEGRRARLVQSILDFQGYEGRERNPWSLSVVASGVDLGADRASAIDEALQTLREWPEDWRTWGVDNAHRVDAGRWPNDRFRRAQFDAVFAYDEIRTMKWNTNPYAVEGGGSGRSVLVPTSWLIAYWKLRYFGVLQ